MAKGGKSRAQHRPKTTAETRKALAFGLMSQGKGHAEIARELGISKRRVQEIAKEFATELDARAAETKAAAIDGAVEAKRLAREAAPAVMQRLIEIALYKAPTLAELAEIDVETRLQVLSSAPDIADQTRAGVAVLDRGGVSPKVDIDHKGTLADQLAALLSQSNPVLPK